MTRGDGMTLQTVGVVGLGAMGGAMARVLLQAGFVVRGLDPDPQARERLRECGGVPVLEPSGLRECDALIAMTVDAAQAESALFGSGGKSIAAGSGALAMMCMTAPPPQMKALCEKLADAGCDPLDSPVTGGASGAAAGTLVFMAGGGETTVARARPLTDVLGKAVHHFGESFGAGSAAKMINQLVAGCNLAAVAEAMALGARAGLPAASLFALLQSGAGQSWMADDRVPRMLSGEFVPPKSAVDIFVKDLGIVLDGARELDIPLRIAPAARAMFSAASKAGLGREDDSALVKFCEAARD